MSIIETTPDEVKTRLDVSEPLHLVDVRENDEWAQGRIGGALHIRKAAIEAEMPQRIPDRNAAIVLYCAGGTRSAAAADTLQKLGYVNVVSMRGGIRDWQARRFPVET